MTNENESGEIITDSSASSNLEKMEKAIQSQERGLQENFLDLKQKIEYLEKRVAILESKEYTQETEETSASAIDEMAEEVSEESYKPPEIYFRKKKHFGWKEPTFKETHIPIENLSFKIFGAIGFVLILLGFFYLYSYAVEQGWIGILGRVVLGIIVSLATLAAGEIFRKKNYERFSQLVTGGGISLLYFTVFATYHFQEFRLALSTSLGMNTAQLFLVMVLAVILALRQDSVILTSFAFFLGYLTAFLSGGSHQMMISTFIISAGLVTILWKRTKIAKIYSGNWRIGMYPVSASYLLYGIFFYDSNVIRVLTTPVSSIVYYAILYLICFFTLFNVLSFIFREEEKYVQNADIRNTAIAISNAFSTFGFGLAIVQHYWYPFRGVFVVLLAAIYLGLAHLEKERGHLFKTFFFLSITFLTIAVYIQFESFWIVLAWAIEGLILVNLGFSLNNFDLRRMGYIVLSIASVRTLLWDSINLPFWERTISMMAVIVALYITSYLVSHARLEYDEEVFQELPVILGTVILTVALAIEITDSNGLLAIFSNNARQVLLSVVWAAESIILIVFGFLRRSNPFRSGGALLFGITVAKIFIIDLSDLDIIYRTVVTIIVGLIALGASFIYVKNKERIQGFLQENV